jgi:hypothetical protein
MKKIIVALGLASFVFASASAQACGMDKHEGEAKGSVTEKQSYAKSDKAKASKKSAKKDQAAKADKTRAKL